MRINDYHTKFAELFAEASRSPNAYAEKYWKTLVKMVPSIIAKIKRSTEGPRQHMSQNMSE